MIKVVENTEEVFEFAWQLSQDDQMASYPRLDSPERISDELHRALTLKNQNCIAYYEGNELCGLCFYFWEEDERFAQTIGFLIKSDYDRIADQFIDFISKRLPSYQLDIGVPSTNKNAVRYFSTKRMECVEDSVVVRVTDLHSFAVPSDEAVEEIHAANFNEFALFYDRYAIPAGMYWNSANIRGAVTRFRILVYKRDGQIVGCVCARVGKKLSEIIAVFVGEQLAPEDTERILLQHILASLAREFGKVEEILYFIDSDSADELNSALSVGFNVKEGYRLYRIPL